LLLGSIAIHWNLNTFFMYLLFIFTNITTITAVTSGRLWWLRCSWFSWSSKGERTGKHNCIADSCTVVQILQLKIYSVLFISVTAVEVGREGLYCAGRRCHAFQIQCMIQIVARSFVIQNFVQGKTIFSSNTRFNC
jgi:hypothetical protein